MNTEALKPIYCSADGEETSFKLHKTELKDDRKFYVTWVSEPCPKCGYEWEITMVGK